MQKVVVDIGGSLIKTACVDVDQEGYARIITRFAPVTTPRAFRNLRKEVLELLRSSLSDVSSNTVIICSTGRVRGGVIECSSLINGYSMVKWGDIIREAFGEGINVEVFSDSECAIVGAMSRCPEAQRGIHLHVVCGTGLGVAIANNGLVDREMKLEAKHARSKEEDSIDYPGAGDSRDGMFGLRGIAADYELRARKICSTDYVARMARAGDTYSIDAFNRGAVRAGQIIGAVIESCRADHLTLSGGMIALSESLPDDFYTKTMLATAYARSRSDLVLLKKSSGSDNCLVGAALMSQRSTLR